MNKLNFFLKTTLLAGTTIASAAPLDIDYQHSKIDVAVSATIDSFVGHLDKYEAAVDPGGSTNLPAQAKVTFNFSDLKTGNRDRDTEMLKWLEFSTTPSATFALTGWKQSGTTNIATGELTIHGVRKSIEMPVAIKDAAGNWDITGTTDFDYRDFNLPKIRKLLVLVVDPHLKVSFHLVGKQPASA